MVHSPARWAPYGRPETSRLLKVNHYMLHVRIKMRLGRCVLSRQDTDYTEARVGRSSRPPVHDERYGPPDMDVCIGWHKGRSMGLGP